MATVINKQDLPSSTFEGYLHHANVSFFLSATSPGRGPSLHKHPYEEVFIVLEGNLIFTVGDETIEATGDQIVIAPPNTPHKFVNSGSDVARHIDIHVSPHMITEWLET